MKRLGVFLVLLFSVYGYFAEYESTVGGEDASEQVPMELPADGVSRAAKISQAHLPASSSTAPAALLKK
jgi:hypothetical protein